MQGADTHRQSRALTRAIGSGTGHQVEVRGFPIEAVGCYLSGSAGWYGPMTEADISAIIGLVNPDEAVHQLELRSISRAGPEKIRPSSSCRCPATVLYPW